jgi:F-type H+-transporting ATPase subunit delta
VIHWKAAQSYTRALFEAAQDRGVLARVQKDLELIATVLSQAPEITRFITSPVVKENELQEILSTGFRPSLCDISWNLLQLLFENKRLGLLPLIPVLFQKLYNEDQGIVEASIESAVPISDSLRTDLKNALEKKTGKKIRMHCETNSKLVAGFRISIGEQRIDCSIAGQLERMRKEITIQI